MSYPFACSWRVPPAAERVFVMSRSPSLSWAAVRHVMDVLVQSHVDVSLISEVDWPPFCTIMPNPDDDPGQRPSRAPRIAVASGVVLTHAILLVAVCQAAVILHPPQPGRRS